MFLPRKRLLLLFLFPLLSFLLVFSLSRQSPTQLHANDRPQFVQSTPVPVPPPFRSEQATRKREQATNNRSLSLLSIDDEINNLTATVWNYDPLVASLPPHPKFWGTSQDPKIINVCTKSDHLFCGNSAAVTYYADVVYPPWAINLPHFASEHDKRWFVENMLLMTEFYREFRVEGEEPDFSRICPASIHMCRKFFDFKWPPEQRVVLWSDRFVQGKHIIVDKAVYKGSYACHKWQPAAHHEQVLNHQPDLADFAHDQVFFDLTMEGATFQHFTDSNLPKIAHSWDLIDPNRHPNMKLLAFVSKTAWPAVPLMLDKLGFREKHNIIPGNKGRQVSAAQWVWPCDVPLRHPWHWQKIRSLFGIPNEHIREPMNKIIYFSRNGGTNNGGRKVINEDTLLAEMKALLVRLNRTEVLEVFHHKKVSGIEQHIEYFKNARIVMGPHGGAFYNLIYCPFGTAVMEFYPTSRFGKQASLASFWIPTRLVDGTYYMFPRKSINVKHDMEVDVGAVLAAVEAELTRDDWLPSKR